MMSISPPAGQVPEPSIQYAGHAPQPTGMWDISAMKRPLFQDFIDVMRWLARPVVEDVVWSTPRYEELASLEAEPMISCLIPFS